MGTPKIPKPTYTTSRAVQPQVEAAASEPKTLPLLPPAELKAVVCKTCRRVFDLSSDGTFPDHFFNFRTLKKTCSGSGERYARVERSKPKPAEPHPNSRKAKPSASKSPSREESESPKPRYPRLRLTEDAKAECPACHRMLTPNVERGTMPVHNSGKKRCRMSSRKFEFIPQRGSARVSSTVKHYTDKYKVRSIEEIRREKAKKERSARTRTNEEKRERQRQQRHVDRYALDCHDSWGRDDHSVDPGVSVRTYRGGLPGQGKRR